MTCSSSEFFFPPKDEFPHRLGAELDLIAADWRTEPPTAERIHKTLLGHAGELFARRTLQPFFDAQLVVAKLLVAAGRQFGRQKETVLIESLGLRRQLVPQGVVRSKDSVSRELYDAAYQLAENRGLISPPIPRMSPNAGKRGWPRWRYETATGAIAQIEADAGAPRGRRPANDHDRRPHPRDPGGAHR